MFPFRNFILFLNEDCNKILACLAELPGKQTENRKEKIEQFFPWIKLKLWNTYCMHIYFLLQKVSSANHSDLQVFHLTTFEQKHGIVLTLILYKGLCDSSFLFV